MPDSYRNPASRLLFLDWFRGLAALTMLNGHVFHSFTRAELRADGPFVLTQFMGGMPPAVFLFLTGVTLAFLMDRTEQKGLSAGERMFAVLRRAGYLFALALLFRLQLWTFAWGQSPWTDLFKVDILNCMGLSIAALSVMALFQTAERIRLCAVLGFAIAAVAPLISQFDWSPVPGPLRSYIAPDFNNFTFFPWASFVAFGISAGSILRTAGSHDLPRVMQWGALAGFGMILTGRYFGNLPYSFYSKVDFWLDSPALTVIKLGIILVVMSFAYLWIEFGPARSWSWMRLLGTHSLLVYWVHTELVYGRWFGAWKERLNTSETIAVSAAVIGLMILLCVIKERWQTWRPLPAPSRYPASSGASGD